MGKMGSICRFSRAVSASLVFIVFRTHTRRHVTMALLVLFFPASGYFLKIVNVHIADAYFQIVPLCFPLAIQYVGCLHLSQQ